MRQDGSWEVLPALSGGAAGVSLEATQLKCGSSLGGSALLQKGGFQGAARQLLEESRSILLSNLTNVSNSLIIAHQFFDKVDEDRDGVVTLAQVRTWAENMMSADAFAGLDCDSQIADVFAHAFGSDFSVDGQFGHPLEPHQIDGLVHESSREHVTFKDPEVVGSEGGDSPSHGMGVAWLEAASDEEAGDSRLLRTSIDIAGRLKPMSPVSFDVFRKVVEALSLKTLLRTDGVRQEIPVSDDPPHQRFPTLVASYCDFPATWEHEISVSHGSKAQHATTTWEDAYASGENCIWVVPQADQDVQRVLAEGWFETKGMCLELGCGLGYDSAALAEAGFRVIGVDISSTAISAASAMAKARGLQKNLTFLCVDAFSIPSPTQPLALIWDNTLYQNAQRCDRLGGRGQYHSTRYKELLLRLTVPGSLVLLNVMSSELAECQWQLAQHGFHLPFTSAMRLAMEFVEFFEFVFFREGVYDMSSSFVDQASWLGYEAVSLLGGLPSWCVLMRRREAPKPYAPALPPEEPLLVASRMLARDGFQCPAEPQILKRLVEEEWGERWGAGPTSSLVTAAVEDVGGGDGLAGSTSPTGAGQDALQDERPGAQAATEEQTCGRSAITCQAGKAACEEPVAALDLAGAVDTPLWERVD